MSGIREKLKQNLSPLLVLLVAISLFIYNGEMVKKGAELEFQRCDSYYKNLIKTNYIQIKPVEKNNFVGLNISQNDDYTKIENGDELK
jgi:hypothetical protein